MRTASFEAGHMTAPDQVADLPFFPCTEAVVHTWGARSMSASHDPEHGSGSVRPHPRSMQQGAWERKNGRCSLLVEAGRISEGGRWLECGLPFGSKARLILLYMQTMAIRDQSRFIELGGSLHE